MEGKDPNHPPPYTVSPGQGQPPPGHYPPPQQGYPPPQQGYPPPQGYGYGPPPGHPQAGYSPQPYMQPAMQQQSSTNVVVVGGGAPAQTVIVNQRETVNHCLHFCITLFFPIWIFVWIGLCICYGC